MAAKKQLLCRNRPLCVAPVARTGLVCRSCLSLNADIAAALKGRPLPSAAASREELNRRRVATVTYGNTRGRD